MEEVQEVLKAEKEAEDIIAQAHKESEKIISKARQQAFDKISKEKEKTSLKLDQQLKIRIAALEEEQRRIIQEVRGKADQLRRFSQKKKAEAKRLVLDEVIGVME